MTTLILTYSKFYSFKEIFLSGKYCKFSSLMCNLENQVHSMCFLYEMNKFYKKKHCFALRNECLCLKKFIYIYIYRPMLFIYLVINEVIMSQSCSRQRKRRKEVVLINGCLRRRTQQRDKLNAGNSRQVSCSSRRSGFVRPGAMNLFVQQTERVDSYLDGFASRLFMIRRKNIGECGLPLFVSYLCHRIVVGNTVLRFCLAVSRNFR